MKIGYDLQEQFENAAYEELYKKFDPSDGRVLNYESTELQQKRLSYLADALNVEAGDTVLDVGCGYGHLRQHIPEQAMYTGCDRSTWMLTQARNYVGTPPPRFFKLDIMKEPLPHGEDYDHIVCCGVLYSVNDWSMAHSAIRRMLFSAQKTLALNMKWDDEHSTGLVSKIMRYCRTTTVDTDLIPGEVHVIGRM